MISLHMIFLLCLLPSSIEVVFGRLPEQTLMSECEDIVATNNLGFNAFRARGAGRTDYCCMVGISFHAPGDCELNKPKTTPKKKCRPGYYSEIPNGALRCSKWACLKGGMEYIFDEYSTPFAVKKDGTSTSNMQCSCVGGMYLRVDNIIDVGFCINVSACKPGEEVSVPATQYDDTICTPCKAHYFQPSFIKTGKCKRRKRCPAGKEIQNVQGNSKRDTECAEDAVVVTTESSSTQKVVPTTQVLTEQPQSTERNQEKEVPSQKEDNHRTAATDAFVDGVTTNHTTPNCTITDIPTVVVVVFLSFGGGLVVGLVVVGLVVSILWRRWKKTQNGNGNEEEKAPLITKEMIAAEVQQSAHFNNNSSLVNLNFNESQQQPNGRSNRNEGAVPPEVQPNVNGSLQQPNGRSNRNEGAVPPEVQPNVNGSLHKSCPNLSPDCSGTSNVNCPAEADIQQRPSSVLSGEHSEPSEANNEGTVEQPLTTSVASRPRRPTSAQANTQSSQSATSPGQHNQSNTQNQNCTSHRNQNNQNRRLKKRNADIFNEISQDQDCLNTACKRMEECAEVNRIEEAARHDLFKDCTEKSRVTFGRLIESITNKHGIFFTPESFINNLRKMNSAQKLIDNIQEIITKYDAEH